jgi:hypothetical protein
VPKEGQYTLVAWIADSRPGNLGMKVTTKLEAFKGQ